MHIPITFITGNPKKAEKLAEYLDFPLHHKALDLDEIQSMNLEKIVTHKVKQAFEILKTPVLVEDVGLFFEDLGGLPGPFIKFFVEGAEEQKLCDMIGSNRKAKAACVFGYCDGNNTKFFHGEIKGSISQTPRGNNGFGWDRIFVPYFSDLTAAELSSLDYKRFSNEIKPFQEIQKFLKSV